MAPQLPHTRTGAARSGTVTIAVKRRPWNRRPACYGVGPHAGQCGAVIPSSARYCERCAAVMRQWGAEVRA